MVETIPSLANAENLTIDPTNDYLFVANQAGENVVVFESIMTRGLTTA